MRQVQPVTGILHELFCTLPLPIWPKKYQRITLFKTSPLAVLQNSSTLQQMRAALTRPERTLKHERMQPNSSRFHRSFTFNERSCSHAQPADVFPSQRRLGSQIGSVIRTRDISQCFDIPFCRASSSRETQRNSHSRASDTSPSPSEVALFAAYNSASPLLLADHALIRRDLAAKPPLTDVQPRRSAQSEPDLAVTSETSCGLLQDGTEGTVPTRFTHSLHFSVWTFFCTEPR